MGKKLTLNVDGAELSKEDLKERFDKYNVMYFYGKLGQCKFYWMSPNQSNYGKYIAQPTKNGLVSSIGVARNTCWTEENLKELLVHEMIHMYVTIVEGKNIDGILGHGRRFRWHCKRIKRDYGLNIPIHISGNYGYINKKLNPKLWDRILTWLVDR